MVAQLIAAGTGAFVMATPSLFGYSGAAADVDHVIGPLAVSIGIMAASQILRAMRWMNVPLGIALLASLILTPRPGGGSWAIAVAGLILVTAAFRRGEIDVEFGGGWASLRRKNESEAKS